MAANISAVIGVYDGATGQRADLAFRQPGGFLPINLVLGTGFTYAAVKDGSEVNITLGINTSSVVVPSTRQAIATLPLRVNGGASATLAGDFTYSINAATPSAAGSMSAADKALVDHLVTGSLSNNYAAVGGGVTNAVSADAGAAIEITFASAHGLTEMQSGTVPVHIRNVVGTTEANGRWFATITAANKIKITEPFVNAYISGGDVHVSGGEIAFVQAPTDGVYGLTIDLTGMGDTYDKAFFGVVRTVLIVDGGAITETTIGSGVEVRDDITGGWDETNHIQFALVDNVISVEILGIEDAAAAWECLIRVVHATPPA